MMKRSLRRLSYYLLYLVVVWGVFRYFARFPEVVVELWFKPLIWLTPLFWWQLSMKKRLTFFEGGFWSGIGYGLFGAGIFIFLMELLVGVRFPTSADIVGVALVTAVVEELAFSGVILSVLVSETRREGLSLALSGLAYGLVSLPNNLFVRELPTNLLVGAFLLAFFVSLITGFLRLRSNSVLAGIVAHFVFLVLALS